jgi:type I restriction enzyme R subunit
VTGSAASEDALVEQPALEWLREAGWMHVPGPALGAERGGERKVWSDVVLIGRLRKAVARINPGLPADAVQRVCEAAMTGTSPSLIEDHRGFHELLLSGVQIAWFDDEDVERHAHARLVDFDDPANNEFVAVNQFTVIQGEKNRRPDVLLFVNGLPLGQIELKAPGRGDSAEEAVNQVRHYTATIPNLYRYVEIVGVSDLITARVGTITDGRKHIVYLQPQAHRLHGLTV